MSDRPHAPEGLSDELRREHELVARLRDSRLFREYRSAFQAATGLPLVLRYAGSFDPPLAGVKHMNPFCALMAARSKWCSACLQVQERVENEAASESKTIECFAGLCESMVPVRVGEKVIAHLQTGQIMIRPPTEGKFRSALKLLEQWSDVADVESVRAAYFQTRVLAKPNYDAAVRLLSSFAQHLALLSNELMIQQAAAEPQPIVKARTFIEEHLGEPLSLPQVARAASMSAFYFCKMFKATVGVTFTDYIARTRVKKAKALLLDPNVRVSEAAFEAGFQSLSQFNRVFRRITGETPSDYRDHAHGSPPPRSARVAA